MLGYWRWGRYGMARLLGTLGCCAGTPVGALAQTVEVTSERQLSIDNDLFALRGRGAPPDFDYTHGTRLSLAGAALPARMQRTGLQRRPCRDAAARTAGCTTARLTLGQSIFTPRRDASVPLPGERPYAGWLFVATGAQAVRGARARAIDVTVGVTGPPSGAEVVQEGIHRLLGNRAQVGWRHQVPSRLAVAVDVSQEHASGHSVGAWGRVTAVVGAGASAGTLRSALSAEARVELGGAGARLWRPSDGALARPLGWYVRTGVRQELVGHDVLLTGGRNGARASLLPLVGQGELCAGARGRRVDLRYCQTWRGREYRAQPGAHAYGTLGVWWHGGR